MNSADLLKSILKEVEPEFFDIHDEEAKMIPAPGKWSKVQIVGHLFDSAVNNLARFIRAQQSDDLIFDGYDQEFWVEAQEYQNADWEELVNLFLSMNYQIVRAISKIPIDILNKARKKHSVSWPLYAPHDEDDPMTLDFLIKDYIAHMENHLLQILPEYEPILYQRD